MAIEPSSVAEREESAPRKLPIGVRTALAMTTSLGRGPLPKLRGAVEEKRRRRDGEPRLQSHKTLDDIAFSITACAYYPWRVR